MKFPEAVKYWGNRAKTYGDAYVSSVGGKDGNNLRSQTGRIEPVLHGELVGKRFRSGLDYGCGAMRFTGILAGHCDSVLAVDIIDGQIRPEKIPPNVLFKKVSCPPDLPVRDGSIDLVWICLVLLHVTDDSDYRAVTKEIQRVCAPKAKVLIVDSLFKGNPNHQVPREPAVLSKDFGLASWSHREVVVDEGLTCHFLLGGMRP